MFANMASHSIEVTEAEHPIQLTAYEFVPDKAGAGKYRGGVPFRRDYRFLEHEGVLQVRSDRRDHRPFGLYGGSPGGPSENYLNPDTENRLLPSKLTMTIKRGDVFRHVLAGAGGWGDPLERDPAAVLRDVRNELLSPEKAEADYGVVDRSRTAGRSTRRRPSAAATRSERRAAGPPCRKCSGTIRCRSPAPRNSSTCQSPIASVSTSAAPLPTSCCSARTAACTPRRSSSSVGQLRAGDRRRPRRGVSRDRARPAAAIEEIRHGTTVASNAILEHKGARVGLITTKGFRDVLEIRTLRMPRLYDLTWTKPPPLVERYLRKVVDERIDHRGEVERPLDAGRCRARGRCAARREGRGDRGLPDQLVRQSGARADAQGDHRAQGAALAARASRSRCCPRSRNTSAPRPPSSTPM